MKVTAIGTGYVGLVTGTCLAESGNDVTCLDVDERKIGELQAGRIPIYEPGLEELVLRNHRSGRLKFSTSYEEVIPQADIVFICVGTPTVDEAEGDLRPGEANLQYVEAATRQMAPLLKQGAVVVVKSTVPVGTNRKVAGWLKEETGRTIDVASNPEFLKEGAAIGDFTRPDRVVVGVERDEVAETLRELYRPFLRNEHPFLVMGLESAEMTKYVANCMLATKISFINEMANLCERVGADINDVRRGIGHDQRIGFSFLFPGVGYGGSCFPKDVRALVAVADRHDMETQILNAVDEVNTRQKSVLFQKLRNRFDGDFSGRTIAVWGLSFKPGTDDIREAPALVLLDQLLDAGAEAVRVHDPVAMDNVRAIYGDRLTYCEHHYETLQQADVLVVVTEWNQFRSPDLDYMQHLMREPVVIDGRNLYDPQKMRDAGFAYSGIGLEQAARSS